MIRKLYILLLLVALSASALAQRYADYELFSRKMGTTPTNISDILPNQKIYIDGKTPYYLQWTIINHGPDTLIDKDTIYLKTGQGVVYKVFLYPFLSIDTFGMVPIPNPYPLKVPPGITPPLVITAPWCDSLWITAGPGNTPVIDPDMSNNYFCESVQLNYAWAVGINTINSEKDGFLLYPNPANDRLNVRYDFVNAKKVHILLRNTVGQVVYSYDVGDYSGILMHSIDIGYLPPGMYTAELHYDNHSIISKVMKQ